jgi:WD40 repeat protein
MGVVYQAWQSKLNRLVAIKMVLAGAQAGPEAVARFRTEAEAVGRLQHPHIVQIYEVGEQNGQPFFSMEFVDGGNLAKQLAGTPWGPPPAAQLVELLARAMYYAHQRGIVHRDLTPANILLQMQNAECRMQNEKTAPDSAFCIPKITDFGLAKIVVGGGVTQTRTGDIIGTPSYMAPEQAAGNGQAIGPATDVYALGAILYELLTGRPPFKAAIPLDTVLQVIHQEPVPPGRLQPKVPHDLETVCLKCLQKEAGKRYSSALALAEDLQRFLSGQPVLARRTGPLERAWRWGRRKPALAALFASVALLLLVIAVGASIATVLLRKELQRAEQAERDSQDKLWRSYLDQARAARFSRQAGQRFASLQALGEAAKIVRDLNLGREEILKLRNEAIACLALVDLRLVKRLRLKVELPLDGDKLACDDQLERYAFCDSKGHVLLRRLTDNQEVRRLRAPGPCAFPSFSPDGRFLKVHQASRHIVWDLDKSTPAPQLITEPSVTCIAWHSRWLATGCADGSIRCYDLTSGRGAKRLDKGPRPDALAFRPDGRQLAVTTRAARAVRVIDVASGVVVKSWPVEGGTAGVAWRGDGRFLAAGGTDYRIYVWDMVANQLQSILEGHQNDPIQLRFTGRGELLLSSSWDGTTRVWDPVDGRHLVQFRGTLCAYHAADQRLLLSQEDTSFAVYKLVTGECRTLHHGLIGNRTRRPVIGGPNGLGFHPRRRLLASASFDGVRLWGPDAAAEVAHLPVGFAKVALFRPGGAGLLTHSSAGLNLWPIQTEGRHGNHLRVGPPTMLAVAPGDIENAACWDQKGQVLAAIERAHHRAVVFHFDRPNEKLVLPPHPNLRHVALSPDGQWVATSTWGGNDVRVSETKTGKQVWQLPCRSAGIGFSPDGHWLVIAAGGERTYRFWHVGSWRPGRVVPSDQDSSVLAFTPDSALLAIAGFTNGGVKLIGLPTGKEVAMLQPAQEGTWLTSLCFSRDGGQLAVAMPNHTVLLWDLHAVRQQLADIGLDWDPRSIPAARPAGPPVPLSVDVDYGYLGGDRYGKLQQWDKAAAAFDLACAQQPEQWDFWLGRAVAHLARRDKAGYRAACTGAFQRFRTTPDLVVAAYVSWACALGPGSGVGPANLVRLAERAHAGNPGQYTYLRSLSACLFRAGRYEEALQRLQEARKAQADSPMTWLLLALVHQKLGHAAEARRWLRRASQRIDEVLGDQSRATHWTELAGLRLLQREAAAAVGERATPESRRPN